MLKNNQTSSPKHIIVGLSGGVDSAVTALLLKKNGFQVSAAFMQNWDADNEDPYCTANQDLSDARAVCDQLDIPLLTVNFAKIYWDRVFQHCLDEFINGRTPNPDIGCNQEIKFKVFLEFALQKGADFIATGHYAKIKSTGTSFELLKANDLQKDQSYFLYTLNQTQLATSLFPLSELRKSAVRKIAEQAKLCNFAKKDSTGICFIGERRFRDFLKGFLLAQPGNMETTEGKIIGRHEGIMFYTLGQRQGLNIGGQHAALESPWYVLAKDIKRNVLIVGQGHEHPLLYATQLICQKVNWVSGAEPNLALNYSAKIRYRQEPQMCRIYNNDSFEYLVEFETPQRAITPGQSVVFYDGDICLGGGIILN